MTMKKLSIYVFAALGILGLSVALAQTGKQLLSFEQLFPKSQQLQMGLHKLSETEKEALRAHVEGLLVKIIASSGSSGKATKRVSGGRVYAGVGGGHWIKENVDSGTYIILEDGSLWQIDPLDKIDAMLWLPISDITVTESTSGSLGFDYLLINTDDGEKAHARYMGQE
jgi:hypothetical protein